MQTNSKLRMAHLMPNSYEISFSRGKIDDYAVRLRDENGQFISLTDVFKKSRMFCNAELLNEDDRGKTPKDKTYFKDGELFFYLILLTRKFDWRNIITDLLDIYGMKYVRDGEPDKNRFIPEKPDDAVLNLIESRAKERYGNEAGYYVTLEVFYYGMVAEDNKNEGHLYVKRAMKMLGADLVLKEGMDFKIVSDALRNKKDKDNEDTMPWFAISAACMRRGFIPPTKINEQTAFIKKIKLRCMADIVRKQLKAHLVENEGFTPKAAKERLENKRDENGKETMPWFAVCLAGLRRGILPPIEESKINDYVREIKDAYKNSKTKKHYRNSVREKAA